MLLNNILGSKNRRVYCPKQIACLTGNPVRCALAFAGANRECERSREVLDQVKRRYDGQANLKTAQLTQRNLGYEPYPEEGNLFYLQITDKVGCWYSLER